jgi:hypothetical protein
MEAAMNGRRTMICLGTLALAAALLSTTSLTTYAAEAAPPAAAAGAPPAPSATDLDSILKQTQAPGDAGAAAPGAPAAGAAAGAPAAPDTGGAPAAAGAGGPPPAADSGGAPPPAAAGEAPAAGPAPAAAAAAPAGAPGEAGPPLAANIQVPADPIAKAAFEALDKHCARCHQEGMLQHVKVPQKNFGFVLQLDRLAGDPNFIVAGNPDASKIVQKILNKEMPADYYSGSSLDATPVSPEEFTAIRNWIAELGSAQVASCTHPFITPVEMVHEMAADLSSLDKTRIADTRYITLTHLYNACSTPVEMDVYRKAVVKLLNSLSHVSDIVQLKTIDKEGTIIRFNLKDVGWQPGDWDKILATYPYPARPDDPAYDLLTGQTLSALPFIRGDYFAFAASRAPLYYELLGLPDTFQALQKQMNVDVEKDISGFNVKRAGFQNSGVSRNNRMIERHQIPTGYMWASYDFAGDKDRQNFFEFPLGPGDGPHAFKHQGGEMIFSLPNGFQAYYLAVADGKRIDVGPNVIVQDPKQRDFSVHEGISCMSCHELGIRFNKDEVRDHVLADRTFDKGVRDAVVALFPPVDDMQKVLAGDQMKFLSAMAAAGLAVSDANGKPVFNPDGTPKFPDLNGTDEMIYSLSKRYEDGVSLPLVAAEFGESPDDFTKSVQGAGLDIAVRLGRRLEQGTKVVPRDVIEGQFKDLVTHVSDLQLVDLSSLTAKVAVAPVPKTTPPAVPGETFDLSLVSDRSSYSGADHPVFTITPAHDCFLQLIDVDGNGATTLLYPNQFEQKNFLKAGQDFKFPGEGAPYRFRFTTPGTETVTASCSLQDHPVDGVKLDKSRAFTDLGDYQKHLTRAIVPEGAGGAKPVAPAAAAPATPVVAAVAATDTIARNAIKLSVK